MINIANSCAFINATAIKNETVAIIANTINFPVVSLSSHAGFIFNVVKDKITKTIKLYIISPTVKEFLLLKIR